MSRDLGTDMTLYQVALGTLSQALHDWAWEECKRLASSLTCTNNIGVPCEYLTAAMSHLLTSGNRMLRHLRNIGVSILGY